MKKLIKYDTETLKIQCVIICSKDEDPQLQKEEGFSLHEVPEDSEVRDDTHYGKAIPKKALAYTKTVDGMTLLLTALPPESLVKCMGGEAVVEEDGEVEISFDMPGAYEISVDAPVEYLDETLEVEIG